MEDGQGAPWNGDPDTKPTEAEVGHQQDGRTTSKGSVETGCRQHIKRGLCPAVDANGCLIMMLKLLIKNIAAEIAKTDRSEARIPPK